MERLQKVMAHAGVASRRKCEEIILQGRVTVNGEKVDQLGVKVKSSDRIELDGIPIYKEEPRYFLFYKPKNVISAVSDDKNRPVVLDYFPQIEERIYPIGRLDFDTTGLLLLTNDGEFANRLMHPSYQVPKVYIASLDGIPTPEELKQLEKGVQLDDQITAPAQAKLVTMKRSNRTSVVRLTIHEGWNHQVKRMFAAIGYTVTRLKREQFGFLTLGDLNPGEWRELTAFEVDKLSKMAQVK